MDVIQEMYCETCAAVTAFEACTAAHLLAEDDREDCPEWACTRCGEAIVLAPLTLAAA